MLTNKKSWLFNQHFLLLLLLNVVFFIIAANFLPSRFEENDDVTMLLFASGKYSGTPEAHLVFINYVYGLLLKLLYTWNNQIEWYSVLFAFFHIVSISVISWFIIKNKKILRIYKILFLVILYLIEIRFILLLQFTTTASICGVAGVLLITCKKDYQQVFGILLFVIAGLIRFEAAVMVLVIISPIFLKLIFVKKKITLSRPFLFMFVAVVLVFVMKFIDYQSYQQTSEWKYYQQYNEVRGKINDNPFVSDLKKNLPPNINISDFTLLYDFLPDGHVMNLEKLAELKNRIKQISLGMKVANFLPALKPFYLILLITSFASIVLLLYQKDRLKKLMIALSLLFFFSILFYISTFGVIKSRAFLPMLMAIMMVLYISLEKTEPYGYYFFFIGLVLFNLIFLKQDIFMTNSSKEFRNTQFNQQKELVRQYLQNSNHTLIPYNLAIQFYPPFSISQRFRTGQLYSSGWATFVPLNKGKFDSYLDIIDKHAIFLNKGAYKYISGLLEESIKLNYGIEVYPVIELESKDYVIMRLSKNFK